ncbi:MAG: NAD(P)/FAD-dependent oxidoreductase, partial [Deltaproteobacteria bacterium]|nr:NAD(P)/FAD-dependent oxidoreductase [Deltaproteobacteria bacterium]
RRGYTLDGCVHWLVGSRPGNAMYDIWKALGVMEGRRFVHDEVYLRLEFQDQEPVLFYTDPDRLEAHLTDLSPEDAPRIREFTAAVRRFRGFDPAPAEPPELMGLSGKLRTLASYTPYLRLFGRYGRVTNAEFGARFRDPRLRLAFESLFVPDMTLLFILLNFAWMAEGNGGYPIGGSLPMAQAMADRLEALGGILRTRARVREILVEGDAATGVRLEDGTVLRADWVISAADLRSTVFELLGGRFIDARLRGWLDGGLQPFRPLVLVGLGVARTFPQETRTVGGTSLPLVAPLRVGGTTVERMGFHPYVQDPTLAPEGRTSVMAMLESDWDSWAALAGNRPAYDAEKSRVADAVLESLEARFPGIRKDVEVVDVATPLTFHRYTGNWRGSFEGWIPTAATWRTQLPRTLPGLRRLLLAGHWLVPGGGLPPAAFTGKFAVQVMCRQDGRPFRMHP